MQCPSVRRPVGSFVVLAALSLCLPRPATAQDPSKSSQPISEMSMQDLLSVDVVSTASKFPQAIREAPASITVVTDEEIRRFGYRTLGDVLRSVRGFYTTYDRNYAYVGMRGFARPGDYNTRVLLLVDGHRLNDDIFDQAPIGTDFPIDLSLVDRVEVIRGPASSLYGTNALFGVVNVVTKTGADRPGVRVDAAAGSLATGAAAASYGRLFGDGRELLVSATTYRSAGQRRLHFPEFAADGATDGLAIDLDQDDTSTAFGSLSMGRWSFRAAAVHRHKHVPTASFGSLFGDDREATDDDRAFVSGLYEGPLGRGWMGVARVAYNYYGYEGAYPYDYGDAGTAISQDQAASHALTGELTARRRFGRVHHVSVGTELRRNLHNHQLLREPFADGIDINRPGTTLGVYLQDELRPASWLLLNAGVRLDRLSTYGTHFTPRLAVVLLPRPQTAIKVLHGRAFRAPNNYERFYYNLALGLDADLRPEQIKSSELVWEEALSKYIRTSVTGFVSNVDRLIEQRALGDGSVDDLYFVNAGDARSRGVEAEVELRLDNGIAGRISHTLADVRDHNDLRVSNSPRHLSKFGVQVPLPGIMLGFEGQYVGERLTLDGSSLAPFLLPNITVSSRAEGRMTFSMSVYNAFNHAYSDPGAEEHLQAAIRQDGRTVLFRIGYGF